jgi:hypothetical protein
MVKSEFAREYDANMREYSLLQSTQAGPDQGEAALLQYLGLLQRIQNEKIRYPQNTLRRESGLTYLRLYRLELAAGNSETAGDDMKAAQKELSALGWKAEDLTAGALNKQIETRESNEAKLYNSTGAPLVAAQAKPEKTGKSRP